MSLVITQLDKVITTLADLADNPKIDYLNLVILFSWLQTGFEVFLLQVVYLILYPPLNRLYTTSNLH